MFRCLSRFALVAAIAGGCVRAPAPLDVRAMVAAHGADGARGQLEVRILDSPRDVQARLALARLADEAGRPSQAIEQLEGVILLGGPLGTRWHDDDRARFARLLRARATERMKRRSVTALADLERARSFGARVDEQELAEARSFVAIGELRHVDARTRARGQARLAALRAEPFADPAWIGALEDSTPRDRALFGAWLWAQGAKRAAFEALTTWRERATERDAAGSELGAAYARALAWWTPLEGALPPEVEVAGVERCRFAGARCDVVAIAAESDPGRRAAGIAALMAAPVEPTTDGREAAAWAAIELEVALAGGDRWTTRLAQRVRIESLDRATVPAFARPIFARLAGASVPATPNATEPWQRDVVAAERVLAGERAGEVSARIGALIAPRTPLVEGEPRDAAIAAFLAARGVALNEAGTVLAAYARDPGRADRVARDVVARAADAAPAQAALGTLWTMLADPARARSAWQAAVDSSPEPAYVRGLAEAAARAGDPDAALVHAMTAAAADGDPARVWIAVSRALEGVGAHSHAIEAARNAMDLAGRESLAAALDAAIAASRSMGRVGQADALTVRRARVSPPAAMVRAIDDPTDADAALAAYAQHATVAGIARMWIASRWNPSDVAIRAALIEAIAVDDPRRALLVGELVALAGSPDADVGRAAVRALR